jgi:hypothetical protein
MRNAKHWLNSGAVEQHSFSGVMNHASLFGSPMDESGFGGSQENTTCPDALCQL